MQQAVTPGFVTAWCVTAGAAVPEVVAADAMMLAAGITNNLAATAARAETSTVSTERGLTSNKNNTTPQSFELRHEERETAIGDQRKRRERERVDI